MNKTINKNPVPTPFPIENPSKNFKEFFEDMEKLIESA